MVGRNIGTLTRRVGLGSVQPIPIYSGAIRPTQIGISPIHGFSIDHITIPANQNTILVSHHIQRNSEIKKVLGGIQDLQAPKRGYYSGKSFAPSDGQLTAVMELSIDQRKLPYPSPATNFNRLNSEYKSLRLISDSRKTTVLTADKIHPSSSIIPLEKPGRVVFDGVEFRAVRDLAHMSEKDLRRMLDEGVNPITRSNIRLDGHHHQQQYHRNPGAFIVEIPESLHKGSNKIQHPLGNKKGVGLTKSQRADWTQTRKAMNKERAKQELISRGLLDENY